MKIRGVLTERKEWYWRSAQIVFEWEDIISKKMGLPIFHPFKYTHGIFRRIRKYKLERLFLFIDSLRPVRNYYLYFNMTAETEVYLSSMNNLIPIIIDFWLAESELPAFNKVYSNCRLVLISSKEVFEYLKKNNCPLPIVHFPVSLPDKHITQDLMNYQKTTDFLFAGRRDPVFWEYVRKYTEENPDIEYVYQALDDHTPYYISNKRGRLAGDYISREAYIGLVRSARITFYTTPGIDAAKKNANGFNQVTPRFLELLASGCLVMGRYTDNPDVEFYDMTSICPNIGSYDDFRKHATLFLDDKYAEQHKQKYYSYLSAHSTSSTIEPLEKILKDNSFHYGTNKFKPAE